MGRSLQGSLLCAVLAVAVLRPVEARACATCGCGDPTLTTFGTEQPFAGRLRFSLEALRRSDAVGVPRVDEVRLSEWSLSLGVAYSPLQWLSVIARLPLLFREVQFVDLARDRSFVPGDLEVLGRAVVFRDRNMAPRHLLSVVLGGAAPTSPLQRDVNGALLSRDAQAGTGAWTGIVGPSYTFFLHQWSLYTSALAYVPTHGREGLRPGASLRTTVAGQFQPWTLAAFRLALDTRLDAATFENGVRDPHSGGFIGFVSPAVLLSPAPDLTVLVTARIPVLNALDGQHTEGIFASAAVILDI